jgi:hypothetical protein
MTRLATLLFVVTLTGPASAARVPSTRLLFTHVTNSNGFDTGIAIANTSADPLGTAPESGSCTLSFFGTSAPPPFSTGTIAAGALFVTLASTQAPGFNGYVFADCSFNHAHGITFVSDIGARNLAYGEEALVVPAKKKRPLKGEHLGH